MRQRRPGVSMAACPPPCPLQNAFKYLVYAPSANPFAYRWIPAMERAFDLIGQVSYVDAPRSIMGSTGAQIHPGDNMTTVDQSATSCGIWHHISISVPGEVATPVGQEQPQAPEVQSTGNFSSMLKARIVLDLGNARQRTFDFDIGAGVEFDVKAYWVNEIKVLIPDPNDPPPSLPDVIVEDPHQLATVLTTAVYAASVPQGYKMPLTYSQLFLLAPGDAAEVFMPVMPDAREVAFYTSESQVAAGGALLEFIYLFENLREPVFNTFAPSDFVRVGSVVLPAGASNTDRVLIPGQANAMRITRTFGSDNTAVNVVQVLNV